MTPDEFDRTLAQLTPPALNAPLTALWWAKKGDWDKAHHIVMDEASAEASWVHAYLHRLEGDLANAGYWYAKARQPVATGALDAEWLSMVGALLRRLP